MRLLTPTEEKTLLQSIELAEKRTSGEIRIHIESWCWGDPFVRATKLFSKLSMHQTKERNGVLLYIATRSRKLAIVGDVGIQAKVEQAFWDGLIATLSQGFQGQHYAEALTACVEKCGELLSVHFPYERGDTNELSNDISFG